MAEAPLRVLVEATKLMEPDGDGVKRYLVELLSAMLKQPEVQEARFVVDLYIYGDIVPLLEYRNELRIEVAQRKFGLLWYERYLLAFKDGLKRMLPKLLYDKLAPLYRHSPVRWLLQRVKKGGKAIKRVVQPVRTDRRFAPYHLIHLPLPQHEDPFEGLPTPVIATIHDLTHAIHPEWHQARNIRLAEKGMAWLLRQQAHFIAVSNATAVDIQQCYQVPVERISVVYEAANSQKFRPIAEPERLMDVRRRYSIPEAPYLLTLSTIEPRKNLLRTIAAFRALCSKEPDWGGILVVAGKYGWKNKELYTGLDDPRIIFTGFVEEVDLPVLYSGAVALCYVSLYEGFGLPPLEAMQCGTPVIVGDISSMPEVVGAGGVAVEATDDAAITAAMHQMVCNAQWRQRLSGNALEQAARFSWDTTAVQTLAAYRKALGNDEF